MEMIDGLSSFTSERPGKNSWTERCRNCAIFPNGFCVTKKRVTDAIDVCRCSPGMNARCAANLMRRRAVPAVGTDKHRRVDFSPEVLQESGKQQNRAGDIMGKLL